MREWRSGSPLMEFVEALWGASAMLKVDQVMDIKELSQQGLSIREIARRTGHSRNTVRKVLRGEHSTKMKTGERPSKLDPFKAYVEQRYKDYELSSVRLLEEIRPMGYEGSLATLRRFVRTLRGDVTRKQKLTVRFETAPGQQAQADWAYCGKHELPGGQRIAVYAFVMVLSFSRQMFVHFTTSMRMPQLLRCHMLAFDFFGGWPEHILYDNMKQVRVSKTRWNEQFLDFANHYGFVPKTHRPYRPRTKGKVERLVRYTRESFLRGREFDGLDDLNTQVLHWLTHTANTRVHGTTGKRPCDLVEQEGLTPTSSITPYNFIDPVKRVVSWESMISFKGSRYSVPPAFAGQRVLVTNQGGVIYVHADDMVIAEHPIAVRPGQSIVDKEHIAELWRLTEEQTREPKRRAWQLRFTQSVEQLPLSAFEEAVQ